MRHAGPVRLPAPSLADVARRITFSSAAAAATAAAAAVAPSANSPSPEPIATVLRIRPLLAHEASSAPALAPDAARPNVVHVAPANVLLHNPTIRAAGRASFRFGTVLADDVGQKRVYDVSALGAVEALFRGTDGLVFAYGTSGAGKSWTVVGGAGEERGLLPRAVEDVFQSIQGTGGVEVSGGVEYGVRVSFLEIYNEQCFDLLVKKDKAAEDEKDEKNGVDDEKPGDADPGQSRLKERYEPLGKPAPPRPVRRKVLKLKENIRAKEVYADGLHEFTADNADDVHKLLAFGLKNRVIARTGVNDHSSRSHTVFCLKLTQRVPVDGGGERVIHSKLSIVDLAGNERAARTEASGERQREASAINKSILALGRCLDAMRHNQRIDAAEAARQAPPPPPPPPPPTLVLAEKNANTMSLIPRAKKKVGPAAGVKGARLGARQTVPFRESRLTRLFQYNLENGSAVMIVNVSPAAADADETIHSLTRASIAREVTTAAAKNRVTTVAPDTSRLLSPSVVSKLERQFSSKATADKEKIAQLNAAVVKLEEENVEGLAKLAEAEEEINALAGDCDVLEREKMMLVDKVNELVGMGKAKEMELRKNIADTYEVMLEEKDRHWQADMDEMREAYERRRIGETEALLLTARKKDAQLTARKEARELTERKEREAVERKECARRMSLAVNLNLNHAFDAESDESEEEGEESESVEALVALTVDDLELEEEDYEIEDDSSSGAQT